MDMDVADPVINNHLTDMMQGNQNDDKTQEEKEQHSTAKSRQKKSSSAAAAPKPTTQSKAMRVTTNLDSHIHKHSRVIIEASIKLSGATPAHLQELLKNGQLVDEMSAFCPIDPNGKDKKIYDTSGFPTNMTRYVQCSFLGLKQWQEFISESDAMGKTKEG